MITISTNCKGCKERFNMVAGEEYCPSCIAKMDTSLNPTSGAVR